MNQLNTNQNKPITGPWICCVEYGIPEPLQFDDTANGLHEDHDADAPEPAPSHPGFDETQVIDQAGIELFQPPTDHGDSEENIHDFARYQNSRFRRKRIMTMLVALAGIVLVVGLAVGLTSRFQAEQSEDRGSIGSGDDSANSTGQANGTTSDSYQQLVVNNTGLAAIFLDNGDRVVLFQDVSNNLRRLLYSASLGDWASTSPLLTNVTMRDETPISITTSLKLEESFVYFIDSNNYLTEMIIDWGSRTISTRNLSLSGSDSPIKASPISKGLSGTAFVSSNTSTLYRYLLFQDEFGNTSLIFDNETTLVVQPQDKWTDLSQQMLSSLPDTSFGYPFTSCYSRVVSSTTVASPSGASFSSFTASFFDQHADAKSNQIWTWHNYTAQKFLTSTAPFIGVASGGPPDTIDGTAIQASDYALVDVSSLRGYWVNGNTLSSSVATNGSSGANVRPAPGLFAYPRFAVPASNQNSRQVYLYHQLNGSFLVEEAYDFDVQGWVATPINVAGLPEISLAPQPFGAM